MANDNSIHHFTATDIEKYHRGQLSAKQMHDLEKAALDDPFLADALEGYAVAGVNAGADISELKKRLGEKIEVAKVIPLKAAPSTSFRALRAAVMILFVAGAAFLIYQFGFNNKKDTAVAQNNPAKKEAAPADTVKVLVTTPGSVSSPTTEIKTDSKQGPVNNEQNTLVKEEAHVTTVIPPAGQKGNGETPVVTGETKYEDAVASRATESKPVTNAPAKVADTDAERKLVNKPAPDKKEVAREDYYRDRAKAGIDEEAMVKDKLAQQQNKSVASNRNAVGYVNNTNTFRGRVVDADNNGVPFANVTNVQDNNAGTYTDARGNFNLTYPDSVLTVQVRGLGFENTNVQLRNSVPTNQVVMQDDRKTLTEQVLSNQNSNAVSRRSRDANMKIEEPEPVDGWVYYDAYLANNLEVPEDLKAKPSSGGKVVVSFEVDKNGDPTNIRVEQSLCGKCDEEAKRLVKEGPKFKRNANKKGRTTVTISF